MNKYVKIRFCLFNEYVILVKNSYSWILLIMYNWNKWFMNVRERGGEREWGFLIMFYIKMIILKMLWNVDGIR